ncbi:hypothetical protein [Kitasatospora purpeofusca]|uniref:hypothetical protein n=1 Tax=Kitasatospora purpeofusca TaxID=67352 RepID=UPI0036CA2518
MNAARLRLALLEWAVDRTAAGHPNVDVRAWPTPPDVAPDQVFEVVQESAAAGLVNCAADQHQLRLTPKGIAHIQQVRARRGDRPFRHSQARSALLQWLYDQPGQRGLSLRGYYDLSFFRRDDRSHLDGVQLRDREIRDAYDDLREWGLAQEAGWTIIGITSSIQHPKATANGKLCIEQWGGDVAAYMDYRQGTSAKTIYNINLNDSTAVIDSEGFTQNNQTQAGASPQASSEQERLYTRLLVDNDATMSPATKGYPSDWDDEARSESFATAKHRSKLIAEVEALASAAVHTLWLQAIDADQEVIDLSSNLPWSPEDVAREIERSPQSKRRKQARDALRAQARLELGRDPLVDRARPDDAP